MSKREIENIMTDKKIFNTELLVPTGGLLEAMIFENSNVNISRTIFYNIEIELESFEVEGEIVETMIVLDFIKLDIKNLQDLANRTIEFPVNPTKGYIDGSIYVFYVHNLFHVTKIKFGEIVDNQITAKFDYTIDFEFEGTEYAKTETKQIETVLRFGSLSIYPGILKAKKWNLRKSKRIVSQFCDISDYKNPRIDGDKILFDMNIEKTPHNNV